MQVRFNAVIIFLLFTIISFNNTEARLDHKSNQKNISHKNKGIHQTKIKYLSHLAYKKNQNRFLHHSHIVDLITPGIVLSDSLRYSFFNNRKNCISNPDQLSKLAEKLKKTASPWKQIVRIVHIGDSHIQADLMTRALRKGFQERYGNAGRGIVFPFQLAKTNSPSDIVSFSDASWLAGRITLIKSLVDCGVCGYGLQSDSLDTVLTIGLKTSKRDDDSFDIVRLFTGKNIGSLNIKYNDSEEQTVCIQPENAYGYELFPLKMSTNSLSISQQFPDSTAFVFYGVSFEKKDASGVIYNSIGVNGAQYSSFNNTPLFWEQIGALQADCYIISLGTNEAQNQNLNAVDFGLQVRSMVTHLKQISPDAVFLITTPAPSFYHSLRANAVIKTVADVLLTVSSEEKISSWNLYDIVGGEKEHMIFQNIGIYRPDMLHFNRAGYELQGEMLLTALLNVLKH